MPGLGLNHDHVCVSPTPYPLYHGNHNSSMNCLDIFLKFDKIGQNLNFCCCYNVLTWNFSPKNTQKYHMSGCFNCDAKISHAVLCNVLLQKAIIAISLLNNPYFFC